MVNVFDVERMIAEEHHLFTVDGLSEKHGVCTRTIRRWADDGKVFVAGKIGITLFYSEEPLDARHKYVSKENPLRDKGEKREEGQGIARWYDPFDLR